MPDDNNSCALSEVILLAGACIIIAVLVSILYINMSGDWTVDQETRTRVFVVAMVLFCFNIFLCCYMTKRLGIRICRPQIYEIERSYYRSVNAGDPLLSRDLPPSYDAVTVSTINPPSYEEVTIRYGALDPVAVHHKATG